MLVLKVVNNDAFDIEIHSGADINNDGQIVIEEALSVLQKLLNY